MKLLEVRGRDPEEAGVRDDDDDDDDDDDRGDLEDREDRVDAGVIIFELERSPWDRGRRLRLAVDGGAVRVLEPRLGALHRS